MRKHYESDRERFFADAYLVSGWRGVAFRVLGWETEPTEDTEWDGIYERTGKVLCVMVGDDHIHTVDEDDLTSLSREDYCGECGQVGCTHDGYDRDEEVEEAFAKGT